MHRVGKAYREGARSLNQTMIVGSPVSDWSPLTRPRDPARLSFRPTIPEGRLIESLVKEIEDTILEARDRDPHRPLADWMREIRRFPAASLLEKYEAAERLGPYFPDAGSFAGFLDEHAAIKYGPTTSEEELDDIARALAELADRVAALRARMHERPERPVTQQQTPPIVGAAATATTTPATPATGERGRPYVATYLY
jgi:hypothetical protein